MAPTDFSYLHAAYGRVTRVGLFTKSLQRAEIHAEEAVKSRQIWR